MADQRPNVVLFLTDDISPDDLGCYGSRVVQTPNLDGIAARGLVFDNAYNVISSCSPSRCAIITGRYPHNTGAPELHTPLPPDQVTFVQLLQAAGYHTLLSGKNHMGKGPDLGFDEVSDSKPAGSEKWVQHLKDRPKDKPFFAWFASHDAHHPFTFTEHAPRYDPAEVEVPPMLVDGPGTRRELAEYYHEVSRTDYYAGEILKELEAQGVADNTYFIYCSDNGRPFPRCKVYLYESGIRTPLIIAGPGIKAGRTSSLVSSIDYAATILEWAGIAKPDCIQGRSFTSILKDPGATLREVVFAERNWHVFQGHQRMVRFGDFLYIWNAWPERYNVSGESAWTGKFAAAEELWAAAAAGKLSPAQAQLTLPNQPPEELYHLPSDPHQFQNLVQQSDHQTVLSQARELLQLWQQQTGDSVPTHPTPDRGELHENSERKVQVGEFPGAAAGATQIHAPGPVKLPAP
jgi:arylsulfatase